MDYAHYLPAEGQQAARQIQPPSLHLLDLHQILLVNVCRLLSIRDKLQLRLVCKIFHSLLDDPAPGTGVWGDVFLDDLQDSLTPLDLYRHASSHPLLDIVSRTDTQGRVSLTSPPAAQVVAITRCRYTDSTVYAARCRRASCQRHFGEGVRQARAHYQYTPHAGRSPTSRG